MLVAESIESAYVSLLNRADAELYMIDELKVVDVNRSP